MNNIFENAYFGKPYKTRDGRKALYIGNNTCIIVKETNPKIYFDDGAFSMIAECRFDIISEWQEDIHEDKLDALAKEYIKDKKEPSIRIASYNGFRAGYRKAMEDEQ